MQLKDVWEPLRRGWWWPLVGAALGGLLGFGLSLASTPTYVAQTQLFVSTNLTMSASEVFQGGQFSQQRVASYAELIASEELASRVSDRLDLATSPGELASRISASASPQSVLITVDVSDPSAAQAQRIAQVVGGEFSDFVQEIETVTEGGVAPVKVTVVQAPGLPSDPASPDTRLNVALGALVGLLAGVMGIVARRALDRTVKDPDEAALLAQAPVIASIIRDGDLRDRHVVDRTVGARVAEDYRQLRTNLQFLNVDQPPKVIMMGSAMPSEGKTTATINLALALAEAGRQVVIVDADLRRPRVASYLGMVGGVGLTNVLTGSADVAEVLQVYGETGVTVIGAGPTPPNPSELLASKHMSALIEELRGKSEYVLIDAPPLLPVADATGLAVMADGVLLSVRYGKSRKEQVREASLTLTRVGARTLGLILNIVPPKAGVRSAYGYGYAYEENGKHRP